MASTDYVDPIREHALSLGTRPMPLAAREAAVMAARPRSRRQAPPWNLITVLLLALAMFAVGAQFGAVTMGITR